MIAPDGVAVDVFGWSGGVMNDVQTIVDDLSHELGRPVGVDDRQFRAVAYSSHAEGVDAVRVASILQRQAPQPVREWLTSLGIEKAEPFVRVPENSQLDMAARVCVPLRFAGCLLGYLWLIDRPEPLSAREIETSLRSAEGLSAALYRVMRLEQEERVHERQLLRELLGLSLGEPAAAAERLLAYAMVAADSLYAVVAVAPNHPRGEGAPDVVSVRLTAAMDRLRRAMDPRHLRLVVDGEWIVAVAALAAPGELGERSRALLANVQDSLAEMPTWSATVGVGAPRERLADVAGSYAEARRAIELGRQVAGLGPLVTWSSLGAYRTLSELVRPGAGDVPLPESFLRLLSCPDAATLVPTLEQYLEHAGDARAAAGALFLHKSSLYQRLKRIEEIAQVSLASGDDRLELHLATRLWRMRGAPLR